jgi:hypothetical protein
MLGYRASNAVQLATGSKTPFFFHSEAQHGPKFPVFLEMLKAVANHCDYLAIVYDPPA